MNDLLCGSHAVHMPSTSCLMDLTVQVTRYSRPCSSRITGARTVSVFRSVFTFSPLARLMWLIAISVASLAAHYFHAQRVDAAAAAQEI